VTGAAMKRRLHLLASRDDSGMALLMVIASTLILTIIATAGLGYAVRGQTASRHDQDYTAALQAANAGVQDYIAYVNQYGQTYNTTSALYCANPAMQGGNSVLPTACPWGSTAAWVKVQDPANNYKIDEYFHYDIDTTNVVANGQVTVTASGRVNKVTRSLQATVTNGGATDYVYFTDYETQDPAISNNTSCRPLSGSTPLHWWEMSTSQRTTADNSAGCNIDFISADTLAGPVHSNDTPRISGSPRFTGDFTVADPACKTASASNRYAIANAITDTNGCYRDGGSPTPQFDQPPPTWSKDFIPDDTTNTLSAKAQSLGCVYTGPTRIKFNADATMTVWSRYSTVALNAGCGDYTQLRKGLSQTVTIPPNFLLYVQNGGAAGQCPTTTSTYSGATSSTIGDGLPLANDNNMTAPDQYCNQGNLYVEGSVNGRLTIAAQNDVVITGDLLKAGGPNGDDILGMVALNYVEVFHPVTGSGNELTTTWPHQAVSNVLEIDAALQSLQHVFTVQAFSSGTAQGTLKVRGTIAQKYRGPVGTHSGTTIVTGYGKDYGYDTALRFGPPPYFPHWTNANWTVTLFGEIKPKY
jgi:Tfp pilus assembly protein PilX